MSYKIVSTYLTTSERETSLNLTQSLSVCATILLVGQLLEGTSLYFAAAVYVSLLVVTLTLRSIGITSIAGSLIAYLVFRYLVFSQIAKTLLGQAGDSELLAPDNTISVILVGIVSICAAALLIHKCLGTRRVLQFEFSPEMLIHLRNISLAVGITAALVSRYWGTSDTGEPVYGGIVGIAVLSRNIIYWGILAETWRILIVTNGKQSLSIFLLFLIGLLTMMGILAATKHGAAVPFVAYIVTSCAYRRYITKAQLISIVVVLIGGILFVYPAVQLLKGQVGYGSLDTSKAARFVERLSNPDFFSEEWGAHIELEDNSLLGYSLRYLGTYDDLLSRFILIANTDSVVNAVDEDGIYGPSLITNGFELLLPTFLDPNKPRIAVGDQYMGYYGLRTWGMGGNATLGIFADCYAALGWVGVLFIPFIIMMFFLTEIQLCGTRIAGNLVGCYFFLISLHAFGEVGIADFIVFIGRNNIYDYMFVIIAMYLADFLVNRQSLSMVTSLGLWGPRKEKQNTLIPGVPKAPSGWKRPL